jgi:6-methylsalicylate decarboxylase
MTSHAERARFSRRTLLGTTAATLAAASLPTQVRAQTAGPLVDFHAHFLPQVYLDRAKAAGQSPDGMPAWPAWTLNDHLLLMDLTGIGISVLSISSPGVHFGDDAAASALARLVNDEAASLVSGRKDRLRFLASLPLPDVDGAVREWQRVGGADGCVGAIIMSHAAGLYPGNPRFEPLWQELNKSPTVVLMHPTSPLNWRAVSANRPRPMAEFYFESARACLDMFKATLVERYPNIRLLIPHCGGALPIALDRVMMLAGNGLSGAPSSTPAQVRKLWFDSAGSPFPVQIPALLRHTTADRVVYGSDFCFTPSIGVLAQMASITSAAPSPLGTSWIATMTRNGSVLLNG